MTNTIPTPKTKPKKAMTKTELKKAIAEKCGVTAIAAGEFLAALTEICVAELQKSHDFSIPNIVKIKTKIKPATAAVTKVNPFTKQMQDFKAKPAKTVVKTMPLKVVKQAVV